MIDSLITLILRGTKGVRLVRTRRRRVARGAGPRKEYLKYKEQARALVHAKLEHWNAHYNLSYNKVFIKNQKTKWGSCSTKQNLNFSYRIVLLPEDLQDYLIVHELCHLHHMNHGEYFWSLVAETIPDPHAMNRKLRRFDRDKQINAIHKNHGQPLT